MFSSLCIILLIPGYFFFAKRLQFGGASYAVGHHPIALPCFWFVSADARQTSKLLVKDPHRPQRREKVTGESSSSRGSRNTVMSFWHRGGGMHSGPFYHCCPSFLYYAFKSSWPCAQYCFLQLTQLSSAQLDGSQNGWDPKPSLRKNKYLAQGCHEESDGCTNGVAHKDSKPWRFSVCRVNHMARLR